MFSVLTGSQAEATCKSRVQFIITGDRGESDIRSMPRMTFHRGGIDSFVMTTRRSLGELLYLRIWHDNTGIFVRGIPRESLFVKTFRKCTTYKWSVGVPNSLISIRLI